VVRPLLSPFVSTQKSAKKWPKMVTHGNATVRVYRNAHPGTKTGFIFVLAWKGCDGRRQREKFADEADAIREAQTKAFTLSQGNIDGADVTRGDRDELQAARAIAGKTPLLAALNEWAKVRDITQGQPIAAAEAWAVRNVAKHERVKVGEVVGHFLKAKTGAGVQTVKNHNHIFEDIKTEFGETFMDTVSAIQLGAFLSKREHPSTRNTFRKHMVGLWRWAQKQGYLPREFKTEAEQTDRATEGPQEIGIISAATFRALLVHFRAKHPEYLAPLVLAGFCGLRRSEIHAQTWEDIELARKHVRVTKAKRGTPSRRLVPLCDSAVLWLLLCKDRKGHVSSNLAIDRIRDIARTTTNKDGTTKFPLLPENAFRHSFITHRVAQLSNVAEVALEAGNSSTIIFKHYRELVTKDEGAEWFAITPDTVGKVFEMPKRKVANA
jgi:integrase